MLNVLLDSPKINVKAITLTNPDNDKGWATTPLVALLSSASYNSKLDNVVRLIKMGVDINYHSEFNNKFSALIVATFGKQDEESKAVTMAILNNAGHKLNINYMGKYDSTALNCSFNSQHDEAVETMVSESVEHAFTDMAERVFTEARLKAEELLPAVEMVLSQGLARDDERAEIESSVEAVRKALASGAANPLKSAVQRLDTATEALAARLVEQAMDEALERGMADG